MACHVCHGCASSIPVTSLCPMTTHLPGVAAEEEDEDEPGALGQAGDDSENNENEAGNRARKRYPYALGTPTAPCQA